MRRAGYLSRSAALGRSDIEPAHLWHVALPRLYAYTCTVALRGDIMEQREDIIELLKRIEQNQERALQAQEKHLALAQAQLERSNQSISESIELQRVAIARQAQVRNIALPLIIVLLILLGYLLVKWRVF
jgi:hypothetical protein